MRATGKPAHHHLCPEDCQRIAFGAVEGETSGFIVVDGEEGSAYDFVGFPVFSPDSQHIAYYVILGNRRFVVVDDDEGKEYVYIIKGNIIFDSPTSFHYLAIKDNKIYLVEETINN